MSADIRLAGIFELPGNQDQPAKSEIPAYPAGFRRLYGFSRCTACQPMSRRHRLCGLWMRSTA
jgi:hypothetical protein